MRATAKIDLSQRNASGQGLLWNRLTFTRGAEVTSHIIAGQCQTRPVTIKVSSDHLSIMVNQSSLWIAKSDAYAKCLSQAGITEIALSEKINAKQVKNILDILTSRSKSALKLALMKAGVALTEAGSEPLPLTYGFTDFHQLVSLPKADFYRHRFFDKELLADAHFFTKFTAALGGIFGLLAGVNSPTTPHEIISFRDHILPNLLGGVIGGYLLPFAGYFGLSAFSSIRYSVDYLKRLKVSYTEYKLTRDLLQGKSPAGSSQLPEIMKRVKNELFGISLAACLADKTKAEKLSG